MNENGRSKGVMVLTGRVEIRLEGFCLRCPQDTADRAQETREAEGTAEETKVPVAPAPPKVPARKHETLAQIIARAIKELGYKDAKAAAGACGLGYSLFRKVLAEGHVPRDEQLIGYAEKMGLDKERLIRVGHYERAPKEAQAYLERLLAD